MKGPTIRVCADGKARRTSRPPMSAVRGTMMWAIASQAGASPAAGSLAGKKLIWLRPILGAIMPRGTMAPRARRFRSGRRGLGLAGGGFCRLADTGRFHHEIVMPAIERHRHAEFLRLGLGVASGKIDDERVLHAEHGVGGEIGIALGEQMR